MINWIIHVVFLAALAIICFKKLNTDLPLILFSFTLLVKLMAGLVLGWIFASYYQFGDTFVFFEKSRVLAKLPIREYLEAIFSSSTYEVSDEPRVLFFTKFLSFFVRITNGSYWISSLYLSFISFCAAWYLVKVLKNIYPSILTISIVSFLFMPTVVFWSSGILKDSLAFSALAFFVSTVLRVYHKNKISFFEMLLFVLGIFILLKMKHYLLISFLLLTGLLSFFTLIKRSSLNYRLIGIGIFVIAVIATQFIHPHLKFDRLIQTLYKNNQTITTHTDPQKRLSIDIASPEVLSLLKEIPEAMHIGLFRPSLFDETSIWGWFHRIENTILAFLFSFSVLLYLKYQPKLDLSLVISSMITMLILGTILSLSTPNFGTLVRYKNAFLPYFFLLCSVLPYKFLTTKEIQ
ncbi:MAG: hypothetical protein AAF600_01825 [Bacteroidota bacterium]